MARALMFQGTGSNVGKSVLVAGLARALTRRGLRVRPFKPQNMSNNAAVTDDGGEIGRAQALQARACKVAPSVHMNPVLLKPQSETGAQVVVQGRVHGQMRARAYQQAKRDLMPAVLESFRTLERDADIVLVEGAGSASEVNLRENDIANMGFAEAADVDVVLIGDIDRGGVIASLVGTQAVLPPHDAARIRGFIVNRMRGDPALFSSGMTFVAERTGWEALGLVPFLDRVRELPPEDTGDLEALIPPARAGTGRVRIAVPLLPMIANFDDLDPLRLDPDVELLTVISGKPLPPCDLVVLPGSKATMSDMAELRRQGWDIDLHAHVRRGGYVMGICGGYQMLGTMLHDPGEHESSVSFVEGLGLLEVETHMEQDKIVHTAEGVILPECVPISGYEIHVGRTHGKDTAHPFATLNGHADGAISRNGRVWGTYLHGAFDRGTARHALLARLKQGTDAASPGLDRDAIVEEALDALAGHLETHLDIDALLEISMAREKRVSAHL